jgi:hypothetical protein
VLLLAPKSWRTIVRRPLYPRLYRLARRTHRRLLADGDGQFGRTTAVRIETALDVERELFLSALRIELTNRRAYFAEGGELHDSRQRLHVRLSDIQTVVDAILSAAGSSGGSPGHSAGRVMLVQLDGRRVRPLATLPTALARESPTRIDLWILERASTDTPDEGLFSVVEIDFWRTIPNSFRGSEYLDAPRPNAFATWMRTTDFDRVTRSSVEREPPRLEDLDAGRNLYSCDYPIDVVYTWVDDQDPAWRAVKERYLPLDDPAVGRGERRGHLSERFRNRDELRYSLRSLEMFAPFVRKIFIVTMDQVPAWLNIDHPQIEIVSHREIYRDVTVLPTFNSSSIETQLHHIDGLAEHFIYLNDDVFLGRMCSASDFFHANGIAKFFPAKHSIAAPVINESAEEYLLADRNAIEAFARDFGWVVHKPMGHVPHATRRSVLAELEQRYSNEFAACTSHRFRSAQDLRPIAFMAHHYGFATGRAVPDGITQSYLALWKPQIADQLADLLRTRSVKTFCLNDVGVPAGRAAEVDNLVATFLARYFPLPSAFERCPTVALARVAA